jgi:hypothetical protein
MSADHDDLVIGLDAAHGVLLHNLRDTRFIGLHARIGKHRLSLHILVVLFVDHADLLTIVIVINFLLLLL